MSMPTTEFDQIALNQGQKSLSKNPVTTENDPFAQLEKH